MAPRRENQRDTSRRSLEGLGYLGMQLATPARHNRSVTYVDRAFRLKCVSMNVRIPMRK
ncbi:hypothetical protein [Collimonas silvisoli]|uniref:hypothetical protein n=1 Tax=Collimonas silvisoli TaxID=2825884 RepID=UPI001B8C43AB|nr:hypothetical protein [Collimonas silvisoli]